MTTTPVDLSTESPSGDVAGDVGDGGSPVRGRSPGQLAWRRLKRDRLGIVSAIVLGVYVFLAITGQWILDLMHRSATATNSTLLDGNGNPGPHGGITSHYFFGVEPSLGRDMFPQVLLGMRTSLTIAVLVTLLTTAIGVVAGIASGYSRGMADAVIARVIDLFLAFPVLLFAIAFIPIVQQTLQPNPDSNGVWLRITLLLALLVLFGWPYFSRLIRGQTVVLRDREFIEAARAVGAGPGHIIFKQILPNLWAPILITVSLSIPALITTEAALSFLGVGVVEPIPDLGRTLQNSIPFVQNDPWYFLFPGVVLVVLVLAFNLLGDSVRDALDPKSFR